MIDGEMRGFLEGGCSLIVATVAADGMPRATRAWGLDVAAADEDQVRLLLAADDPETAENLRSTGAVAVTATDVATMRSLQGKGRAVSVDTATPADKRRAERHQLAFFDNLHRVDGTPRPLFDRILPRRYWALTAILDQWFDQTPGPRAGAAADGGPA